MFFLYHIFVNILVADINVYIYTVLYRFCLNKLIKNRSPNKLEFVLLYNKVLANIRFLLASIYRKYVL